jgi:Asp-tRNA(Asn)/Glu-tRNA(Gln) amidotransferase C subunit
LLRRDGDGYISREDFEAVLEAAHLKTTEEDKAIMVKTFPGI